MTRPARLLRVTRYEHRTSLQMHTEQPARGWPARPVAGRRPRGQPGRAEEAHRHRRCRAAGPGPAEARRWRHAVKPPSPGPRRLGCQRSAAWCRVAAACWPRGAARRQGQRPRRPGAPGCWLLLSFPPERPVLRVPAWLAPEEGQQVGVELIRGRRVSVWSLIWGVCSALAVNECCDLSPWAARKIARWSAYLRYADSDRAETRADELADVIDDRPGKAFQAHHRPVLCWSCHQHMDRTRGHPRNRGRFSP